MDDQMYVVNTVAWTERKIACLEYKRVFVVKNSSKQGVYKMCGGKGRECCCAEL